LSELTPGASIRDKYEIVDKIGSGGMAVVYRARHRAFGETFAIKVVSGLLAGNEEFLARFKNEAIITRRLRHPNAVRVDDLDTTDDGLPFIVMEYVDGQSLRKVINTQGAIPVPRALEIARQAASALAAAHELGIVHRDIKPDNILLVPQKDGTDVVKVLDFGIAKVREGSIALEGGYTPTQTGMIVGTPQYISPEQALGMRGDDIDGRADIYSLGVVLYEMLTGELPFHSDTPMGMMLHHIQSPPRPLREVRADLPIAQTLSDVLLKTLAKDPSRRFQTAADLAQALGRAHEVPATAAHPAAPTPRKPTPRPVTPRRSPMPTVRPIEPMASGGRGFTLPMHPTLLSAGAVGLLLVGLVIFWPSLPARKPASPAPAPVVAVTTSERAEAAPAAAPAEAAPPDDAQIQREVAQQLSASEQLQSAAIEATVESGVVTLSGKGTAAQVELAAALAKSVSGVKEVRSAVEGESVVPAVAVDMRVQDLVAEGYSLIERGKFDDALSKFSAALEIDPSHGTARLGLERARAGKR
jgi:eukaryotic-like serine/threonine-protein kinase